MISPGFEGIRTSLRAALVLSSREVCVVLHMATLILAHGGKDGITLRPSSPAAFPHGFSRMVTGWVFAALSFVGFEGATTLGHEVREPRRLVSRATVVGVLAVGLPYVFSVWVEVIGLGPKATNALNGSDTPRPTLASMYARWVKWPVIIALVSSMCAVTIKSANGFARIVKTLDADGLLPKPLAFVDPKRHTPSRAMFLTGGFGIASALIVGAVSAGLGNPTGGSNVHGHLGFLLTLGIVLAYVLTNVVAVRHSLAAHRFNVLRHAVLALVGGGA